jgi:hypothetical protein
VGGAKSGMMASELSTIGITPGSEMVVEMPDAEAAAVMMSKSVMTARTRGWFVEAKDESKGTVFRDMKL